MQRLSEATRYTVYYTRGSEPEAHFECRAADRGAAIGELSKSLKATDYTVTRVVPGWPERAKKGKPK